MKPARLLVAQSVTLGLLLANLVIPGSAVFLEAFGSARLPFVYLLVAVAGSAFSILINRLQSRFGLYQLAVGATLASAAAAALCWLLVAVANRPWGGFIVLTLFAVQLQLGFVFIGAQVGAIFDVQQLKRIFPRVVAGFVFGFMIGGIAARPLLAMVDRAEHLLAVAAIITIGLALLMGATSRVAGLTETEAPAEPESAGGAEGPVEALTPTPTLRALLTVPLVAAVFVYQVLSATGTQLVEYLVYDRAAARYVGAEELASFMGSFTALLNLADLVILVLLGGLLMARYGLRVGVAANPIIVTGLVVIAVIVSVIGGTESTALFAVVGIARIADLTMADVATRTSVNATFQVLPPHQRLAAQVGVEGAGVPIALGFTAALILTINALWESPVIPIIVATTAICVAWCAISIVVYKRYREAAVVAARRRLLDDVLVDIAEPATRNALLALARSDAPRDVATAIDLLVSAEVDEVESILAVAADSDHVEIRHAVLHHLVDRHPGKALEVAAACVASLELRHKLDGLRTLARLGRKQPHENEITTIATGHLLAAADHSDDRVRAVAIGALLSMGDQPTASVSTLVESLLASAAIDDRVLAANGLGEAGTDYAANRLLGLLHDPHALVREAAVSSIGALNDSQQVSIFSQLLSSGDDSMTDLFLRRSAGSSGPMTCAAVAEWLPSADPTLVPRVVRFLSSNGWRVTDDDPTAKAFGLAVDRVISDRIDVAAIAGRWSADLSEGDQLVDATPTIDRLRRAVDAERTEAQRQLIDALALVHDPHLLSRVRQLWSHRHKSGASKRDHAMAREAMELVLDQRHRAPVLDALADLADQGPSACSLGAVRRLAASSDWALEADWLQATAVAVLVEAGDSALTTLDPHGPITNELLDAL